VSLNYVGGQPVQRRDAGTGSVFGNMNRRAPASAPKVVAQTGADAVQLSKMQREQQDVIRINEEPPSKAVRRVEAKTFYLVDGVWTDSEFKAEAKLPETAVVFGSDEYFALVKQNEKLASYFALGERVVVVLDGRVYRVNDK
jgi:Ca-activated chloride channel family protein